MCLYFRVYAVCFVVPWKITMIDVLRHFCSYSWSQKGVLFALAPAPLCNQHFRVYNSWRLPKTFQSTSHLCLSGCQPEIQCNGVNGVPKHHIIFPWSCVEKSAQTWASTNVFMSCVAGQGKSAVSGGLCPIVFDDNLMGPSAYQGFISERASKCTKAVAYLERARAKASGLVL